MLEKGFYKLKKYIVFFYVYAFLGWIIDVSIVFVSDGILENRGFLYEPICPMYGFAALVLILLSQVFKGKGSIIKKNNFSNIMVLCVRIFNIIGFRSVFWNKMVGLF